MHVLGGHRCPKPPPTATDEMSRAREDSAQSDAAGVWATAQRRPGRPGRPYRTRLVLRKRTAGSRRPSQRGVSVGDVVVVVPRSSRFIEQVLGREVDLVDYGGLKPKLDDDIRHEAVLL